MKEILTLLISKASYIAALFACTGVFLPKTTNIVTIKVFNSTLSEASEGQTRFKKTNDIWWLCKNNLDNLGGFPIFPRFSSPVYLKNWKNWIPGLF